MPDQRKPIPRDESLRPAAPRPATRSEVDYDAAIARAKSDLKSDFDFALGGLKAHTERVLPEMVKTAVDEAVASIEGRLDDQDKVAKSTLDAVTALTAEKKYQLLYEAKQREEEDHRVAMMKVTTETAFLAAQTQHVVAQTKHVTVDTKHAEQSDPKADSAKRHKIAIATLIIALISAIGGLGVCSNAHQAPHIAAPADESHH